MAPSLPSTGPYVGPRPFQAGEKIYGRERENNTLLDLVVAERIVLLYSPSGAGKSSLIQAALLPGLKEKGFRVLHTIRTNVEPPPALAALTGFNRYVYSALASLESEVEAGHRYPDAELACMTLEAYLSRRVKEITDSGQDAPLLVLVLDQFEEVLINDPTDRDAKTEFFTQLGVALRDRTRWALFSMREDYLAALDPFLRLIPTRLVSRFRLDLLDIDGAIQAIREPVRALGMDFEEDAAQKLAEDLSIVKVQQQDGSIEELQGLYVEPFQLQVVCSKLWQDLPETEHTITVKDVQAIGDINAALGGYYDGQVAAVAKRSGVNELDIRRWFDQKLITVGNIRNQVVLGVGSTEGLDNHAVFALEDAYLIRSDKRGGAIWFELAHDRLIQPIRLSNSRWFIQNLVPLQRQAEVWDDHGRPEGMLLTGKLLADAEAWAAQHQSELTPSEKAYLDMGIAARTAAERDARYNLRIRRLALVASIVGIIAAIVGAIAVYFLLESRRQSAIATAREQSFNAIDNLSVNPERSMLIALNAINSLGGPGKAVPEAIVALHRAIQASRLTLALTSSREQYAVKFSPDGKRIATGDRGSDITLWDSTTGRRLLTLSTPGATFVTALAFTPDGRRLGASYQQGGVVIWDLDTQKATRYPQGAGQPTSAAADHAWAVDISPDGKLVAGGFSDGQVVVWSAATGEKQRTFERNNSVVNSVRFSPDGTRLATGGADGLGVVWDLQTSQEKLVLTGHQSTVYHVSYSPDGRLIATASGDRTIRLWDAATGDLLDVLSGHLDWVYDAEFTPDSAGLVTASADSSVRVWRTRGAGPGWYEVLRMAGHTGQVYGVAVSPDGSHVASASQDKSTRIWDISSRGSRELATLPAGDRVSSLARTPDTGQMASGMSTGGVKIWNIGNPSSIPAPVLTLNIPGSIQVAYSFNGKYLAGASTNGQVIVWDAAAGYRQVWTQTVNRVQISSLSFSPDDKMLLTGGDDGQIIVWNAADGKQVRVLFPDPNTYTAFSGKPVNSLDVRPYSYPNMVVAAYGFGVLVVWNVDTGEQVPGQALNIDNVQGVRFRPDGQQIAAITRDGTVYFIANANSSRQGGFSFGQQVSRREHIGALFALAYSPDSSLLATAGNDLTTRVWDTSTGAEKLTLYGHSESILSAFFTDNNSDLVTGGRDGTIRGYVLDPYSLVELARDRLRSTLTNKDCLTYQQETLCGEDR